MCLQNVHWLHLIVSPASSSSGDHRKGTPEYLIDLPGAHAGYDLASICSGCFHCFLLSVAFTVPLCIHSVPTARCPWLPVPPAWSSQQERFFAPRAVNPAASCASKSFAPITERSVGGQEEREMKTRSSARGEPRRLGNVALLALMLCSVVALSLIRGRFAPIVTSAGDAIKSEDEAVSKEAVNIDAGDETAAEAAVAVEERDKEAAQPKPGGAAAAKPVCYETSRRSDTCEAAGDVRLMGNSQTVYVDTLDREWKTKPYCRKHDTFALSHVKEWTLKPLPSGAGAAPQCTVNSSATAFVLSTGGFTGNPFHDYTDVLIPAFITAHPFGGEVQFLVSSYKSWWVNRYIQIFQQMSRHEVVDIDADGEVRCYPNVVVGPTFHRELGVDASKTPSGYSTADFRKMLRDAFGLERATATPSGDQWDIRRRPRLLIISRRPSRGRAFMNEHAMADMAASLGFDVRVGELDASTDTAKFARLVNSCDVMVGVHGAGLTNMVFLPAGAVVVQVVPYGRLEWLARNTFAEPSAGMEVHYLEYAVQLDETTLSEQYPSDHPVLRDPMAIHKQGWNALKTTYLDKQNVRPHLGRLKNTFLQALKMLPHGRDD